MAVDRLPDFTSLPGVGEHLRGAISFSPSIDEMETAYDDAKYGHFSRKPYIDMIIPTLVDPSMAPPGKHVISCFVQYAPYQLAPELGSWDDQREAFGDAVVDRIAEFAPNIRDIILFRNVQTPLDIERTTGLSEGNIFQGELSLEQLFFNRPVPGYARFRTPVRDLWLCGSATHPGGGIMGANGRIAALEVLRAHGRKGRLRWLRPRVTTPSSSVAGTTAWSLRLIWRGRGCKRSFSNARRASEARLSPPSLRPGSACRRLRTPSVGCGRRSCATSTSSGSVFRSSRPRSAPSRPPPDGSAVTLWGDVARTAEGCVPCRRTTPSLSGVRSARPGAVGLSGRPRREDAARHRIAGSRDALAGLQLGRTFRGLGREDGRTITRFADGGGRLRRRIARERRAAGRDRVARRAVHGDGTVVGGDDGGAADGIGRQRWGSGRADGLCSRRAGRAVGRSRGVGARRRSRDPDRGCGRVDRVEDGRATGVVLESGEEIAARAVV